jgi:ferritin-like metal-binding protein YciE
MNDANRILKTYISDMLALEKSILEMIDRQANDPKLRDHPQAFALVERIRITLRNHTQALDNHLSTMGDKSMAAIKDALTMFAGMAAGMIDRVRMHPISKMLRDDYTALSLSAISYTMLHTTGLALKDTGTAELAARHLHALTPLIVDLSEVIPLVVVKELSEGEWQVDATVGPEAVRNTHHAWTHDSVKKAA